MHNPILEGKNLSKSYTDFESGKSLKACRDVDFYINKGETVGIVGESGCGKSTLLKMLAKLESPTEGELFFENNNITNIKGRDLKEHRKNIQMVFQDPSTAFSPRMKVDDCLLEPIENFYKLSKKDKKNKVNELLEQVELPTDYANRYCHAMSGGQRQRLGIARALSLDPQILVCDEATSALDVSIQKNIIDLLVDIQRKRDLSIIFVCHDISLVASFTHRIMIMYLGTVVETLNSCDLQQKACHPYSKLLISSIFSTSMDFNKKIEILEGDVPSPLDIPLGCPFSSRCSSCMDICTKEKPSLKQLSNNHKVACHLF